METKKIIITGGATRIGSAIAKSLAGYDVDITIHFNKSKKSAQKLKTELEVWVKRAKEEREKRKELQTQI